MHSVIVGVGNPIIGDDAAGLEVAKRLKGKINAEIKEAVAGGLELAELIADYDVAVIIDAFQGEGIKEMEVDDYRESVPNHDISFPSAYNMLSRYIKMPRVRIVGIGIRDFQWREGLSDEIKSVIPKVVRKIKEILEEENELVIG